MNCKHGFSLIEVMFGITIASFSIVTIFSYLHHLTQITQKSITQGEVIFQADSHFIKKSKETESVAMLTELENVSGEFSPYEEILKKEIYDKKVLHLVYIPKNKKADEKK